tara:strand:- start:674 stop:1063 length:390 start_codon:yes stop_codon:yes gene_type:complete
MPIYEYECDQCGHNLEALQKISDERLVYCPECGEASLRKKVSAAAFRLKGTGWYETDFKNDKSKKSGDEDTSKTKKIGKEGVKNSDGKGSDVKEGKSKTDKSGNTKSESRTDKKISSTATASKNDSGAS